MNAKFRQGDKVRLTTRAHIDARQELRQRTRTIVCTWYETNHQCCYYQVGARHQGVLVWQFRSYQLQSVSQAQAHKIGRPKTPINPLRAKIKPLAESPSTIIPCDIEPPRF